MSEARDVLLLGATGTAGRATAAALAGAGHRVTALLRPGRDGRQTARRNGPREGCCRRARPALRNGAFPGGDSARTRV